MTKKEFILTSSHEDYLKTIYTLQRQGQEVSNSALARSMSVAPASATNMVKKLADLESREVLLAKLAGAMNGNLAKAVGLFAAPLAQAARALAALQDQKSAGDAPATDAAPAAEAN